MEGTASSDGSFLGELSYSSDPTVIHPEQPTEASSRSSSDGWYLFLPSLSKLQNLQGTDFTPNVTLSDSTIPTNDAQSGVVYQVTVTKTEGESTQSATLNVIATTSMLRSVYFTSSDAETAGRSYVDAAKGNEAAGIASIAKADGMLQKLKKDKTSADVEKIKIHGDSSSGYPKKSYQLKFDKKQELISNAGESKKWLLLSGYNDPTKLQDKIWKDVAKALNYTYTPSADYVNLYYDGEYRGIYELSTKVEVGKNRVDITDMEDAYEGANKGRESYEYGEGETVSTATNKYGRTICYTENLTDPAELGGYLIEMHDTYIDEANGFMDKYGCAVNLKSPEYASKDAVEYISNWYYEFESALDAVDENGNHTGVNPDTGYSWDYYCDSDSLVELYLLCTVSSNADSFWKSTYFYKDVDGKDSPGNDDGTSKMYCRPMWDYDMTLGTGWDYNFGAQSDVMAGKVLINSLLQIPSFQDAVKEYYNAHFEDVQGVLLGESTNTTLGLSSLQGTYDSIKDSVAADRVLWPDTWKNNSLNSAWESGTTVQDVVNEKIRWVRVHKAFLDDYFADMTWYKWGEASYNGDKTHTRTGTAESGVATAKTESCTFDAGAIVKGATASEKGLIRYTCTVCGGSYEEEIDNTELADRAAAGTVDELIAVIGEVGLGSADAIGQARAAYDALTTTQRGYVNNYETLVGDEAVLGYAQAQAAIGEPATQPAEASGGTGSGEAAVGEQMTAGQTATEQTATSSDDAAAGSAAAPDAAAESPAAAGPSGSATSSAPSPTTTTTTTFKKSSASYKVTGSSTVSFTKAANKKTVKVPATVTRGGRIYKVTAITASALKSAKKAKKLVVGRYVRKIAKGALKGTKVKTVVLQTKLLVKETAKGSFEGSKVKTVRVGVGTSSANKKWAEKYGKVFTKKVCGKKVEVTV